MLQPSLMGTVHNGPPGNHVPVVNLACTACQLTYEPDPAASGTGDTGCPRCGGRTWIAQLGADEWSAVSAAASVAGPGGCDCGLSAACGRRLPVAMVELMARSRGVVPALFETAVRCAGMWLRAHPVTVDRHQAGRPMIGQSGRVSA